MLENRLHKSASGLRLTTHGATHTMRARLTFSGTHARSSINTKWTEIKFMADENQVIENQKQILANQEKILAK